MADEVKNEVAEKPKQTFSEVLTASLNEVSEALPQDFNVTRFVQNGVALLNDNETLRTYAKNHGTGQIKLGMMRGAYLGLDFLSNEAYLVPYGSTLNFMPSYKGCVKLAKKYSTRLVKDIYAKVIREGDDFVEKIVDGRPSIDFTPKMLNTGKIIGAFAVCLYEDSGLIYDVMNLDEIEQTRKASKMAGGATWKNYYGEMCKKTVLHRLCKHIPIDFDNPKQADYFNDGMKAEFEKEKPKKASLNELLKEDTEVEDADIEVIDA